MSVNEPNVVEQVANNEATEKSLDELAAERTESCEDDIPLADVKDRYHFVKHIFCFLGLVSVLPFNVFITPTDYWMYKFRDVNNSQAMGIHPNKTKLQTYFFSYMTVASNMPVLFMIFVNVLWGHKYVKCVIGTASRFPPDYMHSLITGQAFSGLFPTFIQILSLIGHVDPLKSALFYFTGTNITIILVFIGFLISQRTTFFKYHESKESTSEEIIDKDTPLMMHIWPYALCGLVSCWVTLSVFPICVLILPRHPNLTLWSGRFFIPLAFFLVYNSSDFCGRILGGILSISHRHLLLTLSILRWLIAVLIIFCNIHPRNHLPVAFKNEACFIFFILLLGFSNGYVFTNAMVAAPKKVAMEYREKVGFILALFASIGVNLGSFTSSLLLEII
ncbi:Equilibrative nucleoside transporter 3-like protein [Dinothrombium tinctorium]|uniref:Equilibrative nucleoside transporter 3-like protein n=1 Tax=Dinothrombium tinctorium TaxID=1965070 RepID=A0A3S3SIQ8_9ACAR|nr:Equilibrative nucleoside transporter 3-like protein [Dinothrombium tinctorium]RWS14640.1 Equilibrative nucleoside transporter 3-like protein [Dinothrombium tinctorium]